MALSSEYSGARGRPRAALFSATRAAVAPIDRREMVAEAGSCVSSTILLEAYLSEACGAVLAEEVLHVSVTSVPIRFKRIKPDLIGIRFLHFEFI